MRYTTCVKFWRYKRKQDPGDVYLSFYDDYQNLVTEHIPLQESAFKIFVKEKYLLLLRKLGISIHYWNIRHNLPYPRDRKVEDLRFIHHVMFDHEEGEKLPLREQLAFNRLYNLYRYEYANFAGSILYSIDNHKAYDHPYAKAYVKRWKLDRLPEWRVLYHGVNYIEYIDLFLSLIDEEIDREKRRIKNFHQKQYRLNKKKNANKRSAKPAAKSSKN